MSQASNTTYSGSCQCCEVQYTIAGEPLMTYACHCTDCQKRTGSAFSMGCIYSLQSLSLTGELTAWARTSDDGHSNTRYSCAGCGNIIYGASSVAPELIKLQPGTMASAQSIPVDAHIWLRSALEWLAIPEDSLQYNTQPASLMDIYQAVIERKKA
ncbi:MAG: GFA family protein [Pseudomonadales bacterium]